MRDRRWRGAAVAAGLVLARAQGASAQGRAAAAPAAAPSVQVSTSASAQPDLCIGVESLAYGSPMLGLTIDLMRTDRACSRIRRAKALQGLGLPAAATQLLCDDREIRAAMTRAGTPCEAVRGGHGSEAR